MLSGFCCGTNGHITLLDFYFGFCHIVEWCYSYSCSHIVLLLVLIYWVSGNILSASFGGMVLEV